jgi:hypothetical protein
VCSWMGRIGDGRFCLVLCEFGEKSIGSALLAMEIMSCRITPGRFHHGKSRQGRREGGSRGVKCPPSPPKIYFYTW